MTFPVLAPRPHIIRNTSGQMAFLPELLGLSSDLVSHADLSRQEQDSRITERFSALNRALLGAPYYLELLGRRGFGPGDLEKPPDLSHFPRLPREVLLEDSFRLVRQDAGLIEREGLVAVRSSGSSGQPVTVYKSRLDCLVMWGVLRFWLTRQGIVLPPRPRSVLLCTLPGGLEYSVRVPVLENGVLHRISAIRPGVEGRLRKANPFVLFTNPEGLLWLLSRQDLVAPAVLLSSAQHLSPSVRRDVMSGFRCPVINYYATTETGPIAWECLLTPGRFHVLVPDMWVESESGELLVTRLRASPFLLLRYETGDRGEVDLEECECGYRGLTITGLSGRCQTRFVNPEGAEVDPWKLAYLFKYQDLRSFRLTQTGKEAFKLELFVPGPPSGLPELMRDLLEALRRLGFPSPVVTAGIREGNPSREAKFEPFQVS